MWSYLRFRFGRASRRWRRTANLWRIWFGNYLNRHVYGAWRKLGVMRWQFLAWVTIISLSFWGVLAGVQTLNSHYLASQPQAGGVYREGVIGDVHGVNPILPESAATADIAKLVYSGLTRVGPQRQILPDLAEKWEISADAKAYTFRLNPQARWHDGKPLTAEDVAFTIGLIQNPDTRSPLQANWQGVKAEVVDAHTIRFVLPKTFTPFLSATTVGILPKHILSSVKPANLRIDEFNLRPVGSGPFKTKYIQTEADYIELAANDSYLRGRPLLDKIRLVRYEKSEDMVEGMAKRQIDGMGTLTVESMSQLKKFSNLDLNTFRLPAYVGLFFNLRRSSLSDANVRQGLAYGTDRTELIKDVLHEQASSEQFPILPGFAGFNPAATHYKYNKPQARGALAQNAQYRSGGKLSYTVVTLNSPEMVQLANAVKAQWNEIGVKINVVATDAKSLQQNYIRPRNFDILLYGENLGLDSDVYGFWHSSQVDDPGLNITGYKSSEADKNLESGRIAKDPLNRANKYSSFVKAWSNDLPAIILYSPHYLYVQSNQLSGFSVQQMSEMSDRWYGVEKWAIKHQVVPKQAQSQKQ